MSLSILYSALGNECSYDHCWELDKEQGPRYYMMVYDGSSVSV